MNSNTPAYPQERDGPMGSHDRKIHYSGLTKRELVAAMALQGLLSGRNGRGINDSAEALNVDARLSVQYADALLTQLEQP